MVDAQAVCSMRQAYGVLVEQTLFHRAISDCLDSLETFHDIRQLDTHIYAWKQPKIMIE